MDDNNRRRRQNEAPYQGQDPRFNTEQSQARAFPSSSTERYRAAPLSTSSPAVRGTAAYSTYYPEPAASFGGALPPNTMQYQQSYPQDQRQQQGFSAYAPDLMYNVAQQAPQSNVYESTPQFQTRQPAAMQMLSDVATPYFPHESAATSGPPGMQHHASSESSTVYPQQSPASRTAPLLHQTYDSSIPMGGMQQSAPDIIGEEDFQTREPGMEQAYTTYQTALKEIFQNIINGRLMDAGKSLLEVSEWILGHVGDLGLTVDEVALHTDRIRLWGEFNTAWLSIFQKQKDMLESGQRIQSSQTLMSQDFINKMAKDLIRMCDVIEKHGLVDYQYGVAEEQIILILGECLDLQESIEGSAQNRGLGRAPP